MTLSRPRATIFSLLLVAACAATSNLPASPDGVVAESITVTSRAFASGSAIPIEFTCDGNDTSFDVTWSSPPEATKSLVITFDDLEPGNSVPTHWLVFDLRPESRTLRAGADPATLGGKVGRTDGSHPGYRGPCPARRSGHHYSLHVIALDRTLGFDESATREVVNAAMEGHVLGSGELLGTFVR